MITVFCSINFLLSILGTLTPGGSTALFIFIKYIFIYISNIYIYIRNIKRVVEPPGVKDPAIR